MELIKENKIAAYNSYKPSGVEWLGEIPVHWKVEKGKWLFKKEKREVRPDDEIITCFRDGEVTLRSNRRLDGFTNALQEHGYQGVRKGDLVIHAMDAFAGAIGVSDSDGKSTPVYSVCTERFPNTVNPFYYAYFLRNLAHSGFIVTLAKGIRERSTDFRYNDFSELLLMFPPLREQTAIAKFLDYRTAKIEEAIAIKKQQIQLLKERKQVLIHKVVTRGLKDNVALKDSGVGWIGEIPECWKVKQFRYMFNLGKGLTITKENLQDEGVCCVNYGEIHSKYSFEVDTEIHPLKCVDKEYLEINSNALIKTGDFVFADTSEDIEGSGNFTYLKSENKIFAGYHTVIARPKEEINSRFFAYIFESDSFRNQVRTEVKGVKVYSITQSILKRPFVWFPLIEEQNEIVEFLDVETTKIEKAVSLKQQEIEKLQEYKSSLINSVVTGKVKVC